jgi:hypothetical protein
MIMILLVALAASPAPVHDRAFWAQIVAHDFAPPAGESPAALLHELSSYLGSPDRELRDDYAYSIPERWIYEDGRLSSDELHGLLALWRGNLRERIGETGTDSVLLRSFSALDLSLLAAYDLKRPFLKGEEFQALLEDALLYLGQEKDVRGYDERTGWMHSAAHTADLLKFLSRNPKLRAGDQARITTAIVAKLAGAGGVFTHGEERRFAAALVSLVRRDDFDPSALRTWASELKESEAKLWRAPAFDHALFLSIENQKNGLTALALALAVSKNLSAAGKELEERLLEVAAS